MPLMLPDAILIEFIQLLKLANSLATPFHMFFCLLRAIFASLTKFSGRWQCRGQSCCEHHLENHHQPHPQTWRPCSWIRSPSYSVLPIAFKASLSHGPSPHVWDSTEMYECLPGPKLSKNMSAVNQPRVEDGKVDQRHLHVSTFGWGRSLETLSQNRHYCVRFGSLSRRECPIFLEVVWCRSRCKNGNCAGNASWVPSFWPNGNWMSVRGWSCH